MHISNTYYRNAYEILIYQLHVSPDHMFHLIFRRLGQKYNKVKIETLLLELPATVTSTCAIIFLL